MYSFSVITTAVVYRCLSFASVSREREMAASLRESYELLGLSTSASEEEVRRAYKQKARECHPDKNPDDPNATEKFQALRQGYERIVSGSSATVGFEHDDDEFFDGFGNLFHFVMLQEMMRRRMREAMLARMFGGMFVDDDSDDDGGFPFVGFFGPPFFQRPRHYEGSTRSQRRRFSEDSRYERSSYEPRSRGTSAKPEQKKEKREPPKPAGNTQPRWKGNRPKTTESRNNNYPNHGKTFDYESSKGKYGQKDFNRDKEVVDEEKERPNRVPKQRQKSKNPSQMTSSEWQKGRKNKQTRKRRQNAKFSSASSSKSDTYKATEEPGFDSESESSDTGHQQFPPQKQSEDKTQEEHFSSSEGAFHRTAKRSQGERKTNEEDSPGEQSTDKGN